MTPVLTVVLRSFLSALLLAGALVAADAAAQVGTIQFAAGDVRIRNAAGIERTAVKGGALAEGDTIITGVGASAQLKMVDNGIMAIRPNTELKLDQYTYKGRADGSERAFMSLVRGGFRTITGLIGRINRGNYRVTTPTATIGIRGTDFEPYYVTEEVRPGQPVGGAPAAPTRLAQAALPVEVTVDVLDGPAQLAQAGGAGGKPPSIPLNATIAKVNTGSIGMSVPKVAASLLVVGPNQAGMATPDGKLAIIPIPTEIFRATPRPGSKPAAKPAADKPAADKPAVAEKPAADKPAADKPAADAPPAAESGEVRTASAADTAPPPPATAEASSTVAASAPATTTTTTTSTTAGSSTTSTITQPITGTGSGGLTVDLTQQTVTTSSGATAPLSQGAFAVQAQSAADQALASANALNALVTGAGALAGADVALAISTVTPNVTTAQTAVTAAQALTINSATASSNASASASAAATALSQNNAALAAFTANGAFADSTAVTAKNDMTAANAALQTANTSIQNSLATVNTNVAALTAAQQAATTALNAANTALGSANSLLAALTAQSLQNSTASAQLALAQNAAAVAQSEATAALAAQNSGNFTAAQQNSLNAQTEALAAAAALAAATQILGGVTSANAASTLAATATTESGNAQSAVTNGTTAATAITTDLAIINANAPIVSTNAPLTAFNNPAVASTNFGHVVSSQAPVASTIRSFMGASVPKPNTNYVLDGNKDLVEIRNTTFEGPGPTDNINDADVKFSGGVAQDHFQAPDNTVYLGRIQGGQVVVSDNTAVVAPFTRLMGPTSAHWLVGLMPGPSSTLSNTFGAVNNVQTVIGTHNYNLTAATHPTDSFGNVGTLNSASVTANLSAQTASAALNLSFSSTDPVYISSRNLSIAASTPNVPIQRDTPAGSLFFESPGLNNIFPPSINCSGADCAGSYVGEIGGAFGGTATGTVGTGLGLSYGFMPAPGANTDNGPDADFIHGVAVLNTATAPVTGVTNVFANNANVRHEARYPVSQLSSSNTFTTLVRNTISLTNPSASTLTGPTSNTNYLFDASGNLVRILDTPYVIFDHGTNIAPTTTQFPAPTPLANAQVSFGGTPVQNFFQAATDTRIGRISGGVVNVTDLTTGMGYLDSLGSRSAHWAVYQAPTTPMTSLTGTFHYTRLDASGNLAATPGAASFATAPTDSYGNVGTLDRARLTANFSNQTVSAGVGISINSGPGGSYGQQQLGGNIFDAQIASDGGFNVSSNAANNPGGTDNFGTSCAGPGCAPNQSYGGRIRGSFTGTGGDGAFFRYTFNTNYADAPTAASAPGGARVFDDYIDGMVAFGKNVDAQIVTPPASLAGPSEVLATYTYFDGAITQSRTEHFSTSDPANFSTDGSGNFLSAKDDLEFDDNRSLYTNGTGTASPATPFTSASGITVGWRSSAPLPLTLTGEDYSGCFGTNAVITSCGNPARTTLVDGLSWARGPQVFPWYLPGAIAAISNSGGTVVTGTASFTLDSAAYIVRDESGLGAGAPSASLVADFNKQAVGFDMTIPVPAGSWAAFNNGTTHAGAIVANVRMDGEGGFHAFNNPELTLPAGINTNRQMTVQFMAGTGPCAPSCSGFGNVQGQFTGAGLTGAGMVFNFLTGGTADRVSGALAFNNDNPQPFSVETPYRLFLMALGQNDLGASNTLGGFPFSFEDENYRVNGGVMARDRVQSDSNGLPVKIDSDYPVATIPTACGSGCTVNKNEISVTYATAGATGVASTGTATPVEFGIDPATGLRWGRYAGASIGVNDRISGASLGTIDATPQNVHVIMTANQSGPTVLPITGTFNYTPVGNTSPTDNSGNIGTLTSASLTANFTAKTVDASVNLNVAGATWNASTTALPIKQGTFFEVEKKLNVSNPAAGTPGALIITRTGTSDTSLAGRLVGGFAGQTGQGAAMAYSLNKGGHSSVGGTTVNGVVGFKR